MDITTSANLPFVKYSTRDRVQARYIIDMMNFVMKVKTFDPEVEISPGTPLLRSMEIAIAQSTASILFISENYFKSKLCQFVLDNLLSRHILTKGKYRIILIVLDNCKVPTFLKKLSCIYVWKYENNMIKYRMKIQDCLLQFMNRISKALKGPLQVFRRIRPRSFVKAVTHSEKILSRLNSMIKRDCIRRERRDLCCILDLYRLLKISKHSILSCKYGDCNFSCSGQNTRDFERHLDKCWYIPVECPNKHCHYKARRSMMKQHSEECLFALVKCSHPNCKHRAKREELTYHMLQCPNRMVSCSNSGCAERVQNKDLHKHLDTCPWTVHPCKTCNEPTRHKDRAKHICTFDTIECPHCNTVLLMKNFEGHLDSCLMECELCGECFPKIKQKKHLCPFMKCQFQFCDYTDVCSKVIQHMNSCVYEPKECHNCGVYVLLKRMKSHLSECETIVKCARCGLRMNKSSTAAHNLLLCIANDKRTSCPLCQKLVKEGSIKTLQDMDLHHEMHKTTEDQDGNLKCSADEDVQYRMKDDINTSHVEHIPNTENYPIGVTLRRSKSCCDSRIRFRKLLKSVKSIGFQISYHPTTASTRRPSTE